MNKNSFKFAMLCLCITFIHLMTCPYMLKPFSPYSAYDHGYKDASGKFPDNCKSSVCRVHSNGFWGNLISK